MLEWSVVGRTKNGHGEDSVCWSGALLEGQKNGHGEDSLCWGGALMKGQKTDMVRTVYVWVESCWKDRKWTW